MIPNTNRLTDYFDELAQDHRRDELRRHRNARSAEWEHHVPNLQFPHEIFYEATSVWIGTYIGTYIPDSSRVISK